MNQFVLIRGIRKDTWYGMRCMIRILLVCVGAVAADIRHRTFFAIQELSNRCTILRGRAIANLLMAM